MASGHFLCLLLFVAWSVSSFNLAFGDSSSLPESVSSHGVEDEKHFKKFPKFKLPFGKPFFKPLPFKPLPFKPHKPKFNLKPPRHVTTSPEEGSLYNNEVSDAAQDVNDDKHLPNFKFLTKLPFPKEKFPFAPKFSFPKKKFPFRKWQFPVPKDINKPHGEQASEEVTKPAESTPSTILPKNYGSKAAELESSASSTTTKP